MKQPYGITEQRQKANFINKNHEETPQLPIDHDGVPQLHARDERIYVVQIQVQSDNFISNSKSDKLTAPNPNPL